MGVRSPPARSDPAGSRTPQPAGPGSVARSAWRSDGRPPARRRDTPVRSAAPSALGPPVRAAPTSPPQAGWGREARCGRPAPYAAPPHPHRTRGTGRAASAPSPRGQARLPCCWRDPGAWPPPGPAPGAPLSPPASPPAGRAPGARAGAGPRGGAAQGPAQGAGSPRAAGPELRSSAPQAGALEKCTCGVVPAELLRPGPTAKLRPGPAGPIAVELPAALAEASAAEASWRRRESNPRPGAGSRRASTCVVRRLVLDPRPPSDGLPRAQPRKGSRLGAPGRDPVDQPAVVVPARPRAFPAETAAYEIRQRERSCWHLSAFPRGLTG